MDGLPQSLADQLVEARNDQVAAANATAAVSTAEKALEAANSAQTEATSKADGSKAAAHAALDAYLTGE